MKNYEKMFIYFCIIIFLLISCASSSYEDTARIVEVKPLTEVVQQGKIISKNKEKYDNYPKDDILITKITNSRSDIWQGILALNIPNAKTNADVYYSDSSHKLSVKYLSIEYSNYRPYKISIKISSFDKTFKPDKIETSGMIGAELYSNVVFPENMPHAITHFDLQGTRFFIMATMFSGTGAQLMKYPEQNYYIVDENGNVYASFTKYEYTLYNQPDMDKYNLIPVIAVYVLVRDIVVLYSKS